MRGGRRRSNVVQQLSSLEGHVVAAVVHQANLVATTDTNGPEADVLDQLLAHGLYLPAIRDRVDNV